MPTTPQYSVNDYPVGTVLTWIQHQEIAIPEIQRPFVWKATKVRDFIDSLYQGYPVGYLITWRAPDVLLKDGTQSVGKRILIDGQQRVISLQAALLVLCQPLIEGYSFLSLIRASSVVNRQFTLARC